MLNELLEIELFDHVYLENVFTDHIYLIFM